MRINKKQFKKHQLKIPKSVKLKFAKEFKAGDVPSNQQIQLAVRLGMVKKNNYGHIDAQSLTNYFNVFIQQRQADDSRH